MGKRGKDTPKKEKEEMKEGHSQEDSKFVSPNFKALIGVDNGNS